MLKAGLTELKPQQLIRKLKNEKQIDCLAMVISSWHFLSALSTIKWLQARHGIRKSLILVFRHSVDGYIVDTNLLLAKDMEGLEVYRFEFGKLPSKREADKYLLKHQKTGREFYVLRPVMPKMEFSVMLYQQKIRTNIIHILIEEGLASYMRDWRGWLAEDWNTGNLGKIWGMLRTRTWRKQWIYTGLRRRGELKENTLFIKKNGHLYRNKRAIAYLKDTLNQLSETYNLSEYESYQNSILFCTQTYGEQECIKEKADLEAIRILCKRFSRQGYHVIIKPHPREKNIEKYLSIGCEVDSRNTVPLECILAGLREKPGCIIGITTTSLVSANIFWDVPAVSMVKLIPRTAYARKIRWEIDNFCELFSDIIQMPETYGQIKI